MFDVIGGDVRQRSMALVRAGGTLVTIAEPPTVLPENGRAIFFVDEADRSQLAELAQRLRDGRLTPNVGAVRPLAEAARRVRLRRSACVRQDDHPSHRGLVNDRDRRRCRHRWRKFRAVDNASARRTRVGDPRFVKSRYDVASAVGPPHLNDGRMRDARGAHAASRHFSCPKPASGINVPRAVASAGFETLALCGQLGSRLPVLRLDRLVGAEGSHGFGPLAWPDDLRKWGLRQYRGWSDTRAPRVGFTAGRARLRFMQSQC